MNEFLLVSLGPRPEAPVEWLVWNPDEARCVDAGRLAHADELPSWRNWPVLIPVMRCCPRSRCW
ncbi:hypothetical protein ACFSHR_13180 [Azotobacter chroococcum]